MNHADVEAEIEARGLGAAGVRFPLYELLLWRDPVTDLPDTDMTVAVVTAGDGFISGYWDDGLKHWIDCASGGEISTPVLAWAAPAGPADLPGLPLADVPVERVRAALFEALDLLEGWVQAKCPKKHQADHRAVIQALARAGGL